MKKLKPGIKFIKGSGFKKYTAIIPISTDKNKKKFIKVSFGDQRYEHYKDIVPKNLGGGLWSHKNHYDKERRKRYRIRHGATGYYLKEYSPAWFSYYFLW